MHPFLTPGHVLALLALGLLWGQRRPLRLRPAAAVFAGGAALVLLLMAAGLVPSVYPPVLVALGLCAGGLVALARPAGSRVLTAAGAAVALAVGLDSGGVDAGATRRRAAKILFATWVSLNLFVVNTAFYSLLLPDLPWARTGVRIVGSWIVAIVLLMLAFYLRR